MNRFAVVFSLLLVGGMSRFDVTYGQDGQASPPPMTLHEAAEAGDVNQVSALLAKGANINQNNKLNWPPLITALLSNQFAAAELLVSKGADVNVKDNQGQTALGFAVKAGQEALVKQLVAKGADVNAMAGPGDNPLSLAEKGGRTEIADFLVKHGGKKPTLDMDGMYGGAPYGRGPAEVAPQPEIVSAAAPAVDLLADPNEIKARVKTFPDLEKAIKETGDKSSTEMRQWEQKKTDNRTVLVRTVQKQFEEEMGVVKKVATEEKAKKTAEAIDTVLARRKARADAAYKEINQLKREEKQVMSANRPVRGATRGRATAGRGTTAYDTQGGAYAGGPDAMPYGSPEPMPGRGKPGEQLDKETEDEIRMWAGANPENKDELAKSVQQQIVADVAAIRTIAVEEEAKKTTAALDGLLLARQERLDGYLRKIQEQELKAQQQAQDPRLAGRTTGRNAPGTQTTPGAPTQPQGQRGTRGVRRR